MSTQPGERPYVVPNAYAPRSRVDGRLVRDLVAFLLCLTGAAGLVSAAFLTSTTLGIATIGAVLLAAGVYLGYDR